MGIFYGREARELGAGSDALGGRHVEKNSRV